MRDIYRADELEPAACAAGWNCSGVGGSDGPISNARQCDH